SLKNNSDKTRKVKFTSGQRIDFKVQNEGDQDVYSYSIDKLFTQEIEEIELKAGEVIEFRETWNYNTNAGERLPAGTYKIVASAVADEVNEVSVEPGTFQAEMPHVEVPAGNTVFRSVRVTGENGEYVITGGASVFDASFFYAGEDSHA